MKTFILTLLSLSATVQGDGELAQDDICALNLKVKEVLRWDQFLFIFTDDPKVYRLSGMSWDGSRFNWDKFEDKSSMLGQNPDKTLVATFVLDYPGRGKRVIAFKKITADNVQQVGAYIYAFDVSGNLDSSTLESINVNPYKYAPYNESLNLASLIMKLPEYSLHDHLTSVTNFPLNGQPKDPRLFLYYKETPNPNQQDGCASCYHSKRYVFLAQEQDYGNAVTKEVNWRVDTNATEKCDDMNGLIINASVAVTDFKTDGDSERFQLMEFFGDHYRTYEVTYQNGKVLELKPQTIDLIVNLFGCNVSTEYTMTFTPPTPPPTTPTIPTTTTTTTPSTAVPTDASPDGETSSSDVTVETPDSQPTPESNTGSTSGRDQTPATTGPTSPTKGGDNKGKPKGSSWWIWLLLILILIIIVVAVVLFFLCSGSSEDKRDAEQPPVQPQAVQPTGELEAPLPPPSKSDASLRSDLDTTPSGQGGSPEDLAGGPTPTPTPTPSGSSGAPPPVPDASPSPSPEPQPPTASPEPFPPDDPPKHIE